MTPTLKAATLAVKLQKNSSNKADNLKTATYMSVLAKAYYFTGQLTKAIETQKLTIDLLADPIQHKSASNMLKYYQEALKAVAK
jgi:hypothetical protein